MTGDQTFPSGPQARSPASASGLTATIAAPSVPALALAQATPAESYTVAFSPLGLARMGAPEAVPAERRAPAWIGLYGTQAYQEIATMGLPVIS